MNEKGIVGLMSMIHLPFVHPAVDGGIKWRITPSFTVSNEKGIVGVMRMIHLPFVHPAVDDGIIHGVRHG